MSAAQRLLRLQNKAAQEAQRAQLAGDRSERASVAVRRLAKGESKGAVGGRVDSFASGGSAGSAGLAQGAGAASSLSGGSTGAGTGLEPLPVPRRDSAGSLSGGGSVSGTSDSTALETPTAAMAGAQPAAGQAPAGAQPPAVAPAAGGAWHQNHRDLPELVVDGAFQAAVGAYHLGGRVFAWARQASTTAALWGWESTFTCAAAGQARARTAARHVRWGARQVWQDPRGAVQGVWDWMRGPGAHEGPDSAGWLSNSLALCQKRTAQVMLSANQIGVACLLTAQGTALVSALGSSWMGSIALYIAAPTILAKRYGGYLGPQPNKTAALLVGLARVAATFGAVRWLWGATTTVSTLGAQSFLPLSMALGLGVTGFGTLASWTHRGTDWSDWSNFLPRADGTVDWGRMARRGAAQLIRLNEIPLTIGWVRDSAVMWSHRLMPGPVPLPPGALLLPTAPFFGLGSQECLAPALPGFFSRGFTALTRQHWAVRQAYAFMRQPAIRVLVHSFPAQCARVAQEAHITTSAEHVDEWEEHAAAVDAKYEAEAAGRRAARQRQIERGQALRAGAPQAATSPARQPEPETAEKS